MPPPMMIESTFSIRALITPIFDETFEPPTMAQKGCCGASISDEMARTSFSIR